MVFVLLLAALLSEASAMPAGPVLPLGLQRLQGHPAPIPVGSLSAATRQTLNSTRARIMEWALVVDGAAAQDGCDTPDRMSCDCTFWNGILCSNPHTSTAVRQMSCGALSRSQSPDGMLWRSPWEAAARNSSNPDWFSRDQGLGTLLALSFLGANGSFYPSWLNYIEAHNGYMCPGKWDCTLYLPFWCTFHKVASARGLASPPASLMTPKLGEGACNNDHAYVYTSVTVNAQGSALHLAALDVYIRRQLGDWDKLMQAAADKVHARDPKNPFFMWLSQGASEELAAVLLGQVPAYNATGGSQRKQWSFCREDSEQAYKDSMGWEFVFLIDHLLAAPVNPGA